MCGLIKQATVENVGSMGDSLLMRVLCLLHAATLEVIWEHITERGHRSKLLLGSLCTVSTHGNVTAHTSDIVKALRFDDTAVKWDVNCVMVQEEHNQIDLRGHGKSPRHYRETTDERKHKWKT